MHLEVGMTTLDQAAHAFLSQKRIAVAGVSRAGDTAATPVFRKLKAAGYHVFAVNPRAITVERDSCFHDLASIPGGVDAVVIATPLNASADVARECVALGIRHVWFHRSVGSGSLTDEALEICRAAGMSVIAGACPMMYCEPVDLAHRCLRWFCRGRTECIDAEQPS